VSDRPTEQKTCPIMTALTMMKTLKDHEPVARAVVWLAEQFSRQPTAARTPGRAL
jgi:hypothetical protein